MSVNPQALRFLQVVLIALCVIFSGYTLYELVRPYRLSSAALSTDQDALAVSEIQTRVNRPILPPEAFSEIVERPLFMENRRPFVPPASKGSKEPKRPHQTEPDISTQISLSAIIIADDERIALIENNRDKKLQKLRQGEAFNGWTLTDIQNNSIAMQRGQETRHIELIVKTSRPVPEKPQDTKTEDAYKQSRMASPTNVSEDANNIK